MRGGAVVSGLLVIVLLCTNFGSGALCTPDTASAADAPKQRLDFSFEARTAKVDFAGQLWDSISISGCGQAYGPGKPDIPVKIVSLELPSRLEHVTLSFGDKVRYESVRLVPVGPETVLGLDGQSGGKALVDEAFYQKDRLLPSKGFQVQKVGEGRNDAGERVFAYEIDIYPLRYNPGKGVAVLYQDCVLCLYYDNRPAPAPSPAVRGPDEKYIVLTSTAVNDSNVLAPLLTWKTRKGLPAKSYSVDWIYANYPGWDNAEKIRNFLIEKYWNNNLTWLQIVGDDNTVPARMVKNPNPVAPFDDNWIPTDTYYACLDVVGSTWDSYNNNHIYGEFFDTDADGLYDAKDLDDAYPDVWVARFASSDTTRVSAWAGNAVAYEKAGASGAWMNSCTLVAPDAGALGNAASTAAKMEEFINKTGGSFGYLSPYYGKLISGGSINRLYERDGALSKAAFTSLLNGGFAFGTWISQGDASGISSATPAVGSILSSSDVASLTNGARKPVIFAMSSQSGKFDAGECLGEVLTENNLANGAMGYVGASRVTSGSSALNYWGNGTGLQMDFMYTMEQARLFNASKLYMGSTLGWAKRYFTGVWTNNPASTFQRDYTVKAFYEYNLLGETNSPVWTDVAGTFNPITWVSEDATYKNVTFTVRNAANNRPMNHTLACLEWYNPPFYQVVETLDNGYANFTIPKTMLSCNVTFTRADFTPFEYSDLPLTDNYPPYTDISITPPLPNGIDGWYKVSPTIRLLPEPGTTTYYRWDSGADQVYNGDEMTALEGEHKLLWHAVDFMNNKEGEKENLFKVDSVIPNTTVAVTPTVPDGDNGWYRTAPEITLTAVDNSSTALKIKYKMDAEPSFADYRDPFTIDEQEHTLHYYTEDYAGNKEPQRSRLFKVDTVLPSSVAQVRPGTPDGQHGWYINPPTISFTIEELNGPYISYRWDDGAMENLTYGATLKPPEGNHTLTYQAADLAGNREPAKTLVIKLDSKTPTTDLVSNPGTPDGSNSWYKTPPTLTFETEVNATLRYKWNLESFTCATGPIQAPEGTNSLTFFATDEAGNREANQVAVFKVDSVVPVTTVNVTPADKGDQYYTKRPKARLSNNENAAIWYYWNTDTSSVQKYSKDLDVGEGEQWLHFWSVDEAGNKEFERTKLFNVDTLPPTVSITLSSQSVTVGDAVTMDLTGSDANGIREYYLDFGDGNNTGWTRTASFTHTYLAPGNYSVTYKGRDAANNEGFGVGRAVEVKAKYIPPEVKPEEKKEGPNLMLIGGVAGIIILVAVVAAVAMSRRRSKPDDFFVQDARVAEEKKKLMPAYDFGPTGGEVQGAEAGTAPAAEYVPAAAATTAAAPSEGARTFNCPKCGNEVEAVADYCYTCGERFKKKGDGPGEPPTRQAPPPQQPPQTGAPARPAAQEYQPSQAYYEAPAQPVYEAAAQPAYEAVAQPVAPQAPPSRPAGGPGDLNDIMSKLESISKPAPAAAAFARRAPPPQRAAPPAQPAPAAPTASAETSTGKMCPKCGTEMARLVELPGAQGEQLKKLMARGQYAFQCRNCNHFEISAWTPAR